LESFGIEIVASGWQAYGTLKLLAPTIPIPNLNLAETPETEIFIATTTTTATATATDITPAAGQLDPTLVEFTTPLLAEAEFKPPLVLPEEISSVPEIVAEVSIAPILPTAATNNTATTKWCSKHNHGVGANIPLELFGKDKSKSDGFTTWCRLCRHDYNHAYYTQHAEPIKQRTTNNRVIRREKAKRKGLEEQK
jgi:hypothetical protein